MYEQFYGFRERPFSITPDPRFVFLSHRHQDALAHLLYGIGRGGSGGFVQLTGEVGTGKTTLCRLLLERLPEHTHVALILNPLLSPVELMRAVCRELGVAVDDEEASLDRLGQRLNERLLAIHASGERAVLIIDEAQAMSRDALEQVRLLTNLETATDKLLQVILLGQPELRETLAQPSLRQLAQRITARYHLAPLSRAETAEYVRHRVRVAGAPRCPFTPAALRTLHHVSGGVPRLINIVADRALMAGFVRESERVTPHLVRLAASEVIDGEAESGGRRWLRYLTAVTVLALLAVGAGMLWGLFSLNPEPVPGEPQPVWEALLEEVSDDESWRELAAVWSQTSAVDVRLACDQGYRNGLACQRLRGSWALLRHLDRPVILRLVSPQAKHVLALRIGREQAVLRTVGQEISVPLAQLDERWHGDFFVVWEDDGQAWSLGDESDAIRQLQQYASRDPVAPWEGPIDGRYTAGFRDWVLDFQRRQGLRPDGIAGPVTRLFLQLTTAPGAPDLEAADEVN